MGVPRLGRQRPRDALGHPARGVARRRDERRARGRRARGAGGGAGRRGGVAGGARGDARTGPPGGLGVRGPARPGAAGGPVPDLAPPRRRPPGPRPGRSRLPQPADAMGARPAADRPRRARRPGPAPPAAAPRRPGARHQGRRAALPPRRGGGDAGGPRCAAHLHAAQPAAQPDRRVGRRVGAGGRLAADRARRRPLPHLVRRRHRRHGGLPHRGGSGRARLRHARLHACDLRRGAADPRAGPTALGSGRRGRGPRQAGRRQHPGQRDHRLRHHVPVPLAAPGLPHGTTEETGSNPVRAAAREDRDVVLRARARRGGPRARRRLAGRARHPCDAAQVRGPLGPLRPRQHGRAGPGGGAGLGASRAPHGGTGRDRRPRLRRPARRRGARRRRRRRHPARRWRRSRPPCP